MAFVGLVLALMLATSRQWFCGLVGAGCCLTVPWCGAAQTRGTELLYEVNAPGAECPDEQTFRTQITRDFFDLFAPGAMETDPESPSVVRIRIIQDTASSPAGLSGTVEIVSRSGRQSMTRLHGVGAGQCEAILREAGAHLAAIVLVPRVNFGVVTRTNSQNTSVRNTAVETSAVRSSVRGNTERVQTDRVHGEAWVAGVLNTVALPEVGFGASVDLAVGTKHWAVALGAEIDLPTEVRISPTGSVGAQRWSGALTGCARWRWFGLCARGLVGALRAQGQGLERDETVVDPSVALGLRAMVRYGFGERLTLWGAVDGLWNITRTELTVQTAGGRDSAVWSEPLGRVVVSLGVGVRIW